MKIEIDPTYYTRRNKQNLFKELSINALKEKTAEINNETTTLEEHAVMLESITRDNREKREIKEGH